MKKSKYSDQELIGILIEKSKELGRSPKQREVSQADIIARRFGTFNNALEKAGLSPLRKSYTKSELINIARQWYDETGRSPKKTDYDSNVYLPDSKTCAKFFGNWTDYLKASGLSPNLKQLDKKHIIHDNELLTLFTLEYRRLNPASKKDFDKRRSDNIPTSGYILNRLGVTWNELKSNIGVNKDDIFHQSIHPNHILKEIKRVYKTIKHSPSITEFEAHSNISGTTVKNKFKSWNNALIAAGIIKKNSTPDKVSESNKELLHIYMEFSKKIGKENSGATVADLDNSDEIYNSGVFLNRFGGMTELRRKLGLKTKRDYHTTYTKDDIEKSLKSIGRISIPELKRKENIPAITTILRLFGKTSMSDVWNEIFPPKTVKEKILALRDHETMTPLEISQIINENVLTVRSVISSCKIKAKKRFHKPRKKIEELNHLIGKKIGKLIVVSILSPQRIECKCECGNKTIISRQYVENGKIVSCGCYMESIGISRRGESRLNNITKEDIESLSNKEICEKYNLSPTSVSLWCKKNNIKLKRAQIPRRSNKPIRKNGSWPEKASPETAARMYDEKSKTVDEICQLLDISRQTFYNYLRKEKHTLNRKNTKSTK